MSGNGYECDTDELYYEWQPKNKIYPVKYICTVNNDKL